MRWWRSWTRNNVREGMEHRVAGAIYDGIGAGYALRRRADPRIASAILSALADARTIVNIGAGTGSYEPTDRIVQAVEPSETMIGQRPEGAAPCMRAAAEALPFEAGAFDAAMAVLTIHHWSDWRAGLREMRRVARRRIVLLTFDAEASNFWLTRDYFPDLMALDRRSCPGLANWPANLGNSTRRPSLSRTIARTASSAPIGAGPMSTSIQSRADRCPRSRALTQRTA